ncbi:DUF397 domain-containing protein [Nocardiopsis sp. CNR-923]|uniref:DUF397 domain-containing protein n=1 Tax=Nocardiopsis sp. CNR-923 TaxID=1904965 RepID=UPI00095AD0A1|nr:DUF397 domain-containing protein [Nocardiopsis sp. CNR-923]OLT27700.1 DUF397 domain-containing protein [Nocardiopsis sp. CNR-923]
MVTSSTSHLHFRKSSYSSAKGQDCVEVADLPAGTAVRDSVHPSAGHLSFPSGEWVALLMSATRP